jgi:hypothetical protein
MFALCIWASKGLPSSPNPCDHAAGGALGRLGLLTHIGNTFLHLFGGLGGTFHTIRHIVRQFRNF